MPIRFPKIDILDCIAECRVYIASSICRAHFLKCYAKKCILSGNPFCLQFFYVSPLACNLSDLPVLHNKDDELKDANEDKK